MKRLSSALLAFCLACGIAAPASASTFSINGYMLMEGQMSNNLSSFKAGDDAWNHFDVNQRIEIQFSWDYSEAIRGQMTARVPSNGTWGNNFDFNTHNMFNLYEAYFQWITPIGGLNIVAGQQAFALPGYMNTESSPVYDDNQTGVSVDIPINDLIGINFDWIRLEAAKGRFFSSYYVGSSEQKAVKDMFNLIIPITTDIVDVTPWASLMLVEEGRTIETAYSLDGVIGSDALAAVGSEEKNQLAYFAGLTSKVKLIDGLNFGIDVLVSGSTMENGEKSTTIAETKSYDNATDYDAAILASNVVSGVITYDNSGTANAWSVTTEETYTYNVSYNMGILADAFVSYDLPFMTIGLNGWYASGDKINLADDKIEYGAILSPCASWGDGTSAYFANAGIINNVGIATPAGTMGGGLNVLSYAIMPKLGIGANVMYVMGTNEYIDTTGNTVSNGSVDFLTTKDSILDIGGKVSYDIYDNFQVKLVGNYLIPNYDNIDTDNAFVVSAGIRYIF